MANGRIAQVFGGCSRFFWRWGMMGAGRKSVKYLFRRMAIFQSFPIFNISIFFHVLQYAWFWHAICSILAGKTQHIAGQYAAFCKAEFSIPASD